MKNIALLFILIISLNACEKIDKFTQFDLPLKTEVTIPAGIPVNTPFNLPSIDLPLETNSVFENNNTAKELIEKASLKKLELKVIDPVDGNFDFIKDLEIFISSDNLPEIKVAWVYDHPNDGKNILLMNTTDEDLTEYLQSDKIQMKVKTTFDEVLTRDHTIEINYTFFIDAKILGI